MTWVRRHVGGGTWLLCLLATLTFTPAHLAADDTMPSAASKRAGSQPAYPLWDGNESVAAYARRAGIREAGITLKLDGNVSMKFVLIPAGKFMMGSPDTEPNRCEDESQHEVEIGRPFYMGVYTVIQRQYEQVMGQNPSYFKGATNPVEMVSWDNAVEFCKVLTKKTQRKVRLPTEAEWEYACRAGTTGPFNTGSTIGTDQANYDGRSADGNGKAGQYRRKTTPVGSFSPNAFGLYDMHGNVWQWCADRYDENYDANSPKADPEAPKSEEYRVLRGGSWSGYPWSCQSASRSKDKPSNRTIGIGFRVVTDLTTEQHVP